MSSRPLAPHGVKLDATHVVAGSSERGSGAGELRADRQSGSIRGTLFLTGVDATDVSLNRGYAGETGAALVYFDRISATEWSLPPSVRIVASSIQ